MKTKALRILVPAIALCLPPFASHAAPGPELDLGAMVQPVPAGAFFSDPEWNIWCGAPIKGDDGKYHLFYSRWPVKYGFNPAWVIHSEIAHAISDHAGGPYKFVDVALPARGIDPATGLKYWDADVTHNPNILRKDGRYYLFYMGNQGDGTYAVHRNNQRVGVAVADKPEGPWKRFDQPIIDVSADPAAFDSLCASNPAATVRPDGHILLIYKGVTQWKGHLMGGSVRHGAAIAEHPEGPYVKTSGHIFDASPGDKTWMLAEDPYIWFSHRYGDAYYAVARDATGRYTGAAGGIALFRSADGLNWRPATKPKVLGSHFQWADGKPSTSRIERPVVLCEDGEPVALFGATNGYVKPPHTSFNVQIPLKSAPVP